MSPVRDFYHVEIDKIGQGKRVRRPPGGESSDIFGTSKNVDGEFSRAVNHVMQPNKLRQDDVDTFPQQSLRSHPDTDSQNRLFGPPEQTNLSRKVVDRLKSNIFPVEKQDNQAVQPSNYDTEGQVSNSNSTTPEKVKTRTRIPPGGVSSGIF
ncbi:microtubule-associated protein Jupiter-like isoform X1 [Tachypleus tridentatus]|uniref:microtubule-associated protein Jupiter-like isoform X1 n=1 Tax=Tachypleus tridentatus TaxID=6853 RepID=UPI003FD529FA